MMIDELTEDLYRALQGVSACPRGCKCCSEHDEQVRAVLKQYLERWQQCAGRPEGDEL